MSTNCIRCGKNERTGPDLVCDDCRETPRPKFQSWAAIQSDALDAISKICVSNKHKDPISDIYCEVNRAKRLISELPSPTTKAEVQSAIGPNIRNAIREGGLLRLKQGMPDKWIFHAQLVLSNGAFFQGDISTTEDGALDNLEAKMAGGDK